MSRRRTPTAAPPRWVEGGDGSEAEERLGGLLMQIPDPEPTGADAERVWRRMSGARRRPASTWVLAPVLAAAAVAFLVFLPADPPAAPPVPDAAFCTVALRAGEVGAGTEGPIAVHAGARLFPGTTVWTGDEGRLVVRFDGRAGALFGAGARASVLREGAGERVRLERGDARFLVAPRGEGGAPFLVEAGGYEVRVLGTGFSVHVGQTTRVTVARGAVEVGGGPSPVVVRTGECWSSDSGRVVPCDAEATPEMLGRLYLEQDLESRLEVAGRGYAVRLDAADAGRAPLDALVPAGPCRVEGVRDERRVTQTPQVPAGATARVDLDALPAPAESVAPPPPVLPTPASAPNRRPRRAPAPEPTPAPAPPAPAEAAPPAPRPVVPPPLATPEPPPLTYRDGARLARQGRYAEAIDAFEAVAATNTAQAELALYEVGRLRHRQLHDLAGARQAFVHYRERFPEGRLRHEVDLTVVEIDLARKDWGSARGEIDAFLARHPESERRAEVTLHRANVLRATGRCADALDDYQRVLTDAPPGSRLSEDASWFAAVCLAEQDRHDEARARLRAYLELFPEGRHRERARSALGEK